jgi:hypothetical protein
LADNESVHYMDGREEKKRERREKKNFFFLVNIIIK